MDNDRREGAPGFGTEMESGTGSRQGDFGRSKTDERARDVGGLKGEYVRDARNSPPRYDLPTEIGEREAVQAGLPMDARPARQPLHDAPARFGAAGFSAGEAQFVKTELTDTPDPRRGEPPDAMAQGLGWFSIGLGLLEVMNAEGLSKWLGAEDRRGVVRAYGFREIANGIAILAQKDVRARSPWMWTRVAGDFLDLYSLKKLHHEDNPKRGNVKIAIAAVLGVTMLDIMTAGLLAER